MRWTKVNGHGSEAEARMQRLAVALAQTPLAPVLTREGKIAVKTQAPVQKGETLLVSLPYAAVVKWRSAELYCSHCFMRLGLRAVQSRFTYDYYGFANCRNLFDHKVKRFSSLLRNEFRSRAIIPQEDNPLSVAIAGFPGESILMADMSIFKLLAEVLSRRFYQDVAESKYNAQIMPETCKEDPRALEGRFVPTFEDVERLPLKDLPEDILNRLRNVARIVELMLNERREIALAALSYEETLQLLIRIYSNLENVYRTSDEGPGPSNNGYGIYPTFSYVERHATEFNCEYYFDGNANIVVRAAQPLDGDTAIICPRLPIDLSIAEPETFKALTDRLQGTAITPPPNLTAPPPPPSVSQTKKR